MSGASGEVEGLIQDPQEFQPHARPNIQTIGLDYHPEHARVHKQMEKLAPKTTKLRLCLYADDDHQIVEGLEACRWSLINNGVSGNDVLGKLAMCRY